ncbi:MAG TPA: hypothetical protein VG755_33410 [Nannocystaceae bacterium]|nr:hypothetical protein [Nannocystaceae bacterium]
MSNSLESFFATMTVEELAQRCGTSVAQIVGAAFGTNAPRAAAAPKRGPGRPPGSGKKRGPGRPPGSGKKRGRPPGSGKKAAAAAAPAAAPGKKASVDTRAAAGRGKFDEAVLAAVKAAKGRVKANDLRKKVGGTSLQMRAALHRLIESGKIKSQGKARGTTYSG